MMISKKPIVRYGIIGCGYQGKRYLDLFSRGKIENGVVTAVCNPVLIQTGDIPCFSNYQEMLASDKCDAIIVATPHFSHCDITTEALKRNIHTMCEKPAGVFASQVKKMNLAADKSNALFSIMLNQRTNPLYSRVREIIQNGQIGLLQRINWIITTWFRPENYYHDSSWKGTWKGEGGGVLINQCPHQLDLLCWMLGETPSSVHGFCSYGKWHNIETEDEVTAVFKYRSGATGVFVTSTGESPGSNRLEIVGTRGK